MPLDYGVKLTGRVGRTEVGVLNVGSRDTSVVDDPSLFIFGQGWVQEIGERGNDFRQQDSRLAVKAQYTFRL